MDSGGEITVVTRGDPCAFHCLEIFHFVEIQSVICLYFHTALQTFKLNFATLIHVSIETF